MGNKSKTILLLFTVLLAISFLLKFSPESFFLKKITLDLSRLPLRLISLSFVPVESIMSCNRSLRYLSSLKKQNQELKIRLMQLEELATQNQRLKNLLSFKEKSEFSLAAARVIAFDASNLRRSLVIDKGKSAGIKLGNPVIVPEGIVGMVIEVGIFASRIILINDPDFSIAAKVKRSNTVGILSGSLDGTCKLKYLDFEDDIVVGDEIISAGKNSRFPAGLSIGKVVQISKDHSGLAILAIVKPDIKIYSLEEVLVITNY